MFWVSECHGVVYRAMDARQVWAANHTPAPDPHPRNCPTSAHPGVVTLHRVVDKGNHTYIVMDYAPDHDLFTRILHGCRYLATT